MIASARTNRNTDAIRNKARNRQARKERVFGMTSKRDQWRFFHTFDVVDALCMLQSSKGRPATNMTSSSLVGGNDSRE
jgi:hypothetical protein